MSALLNGIHDRSSVVQKAYAFALGHLVRVGVSYDKSTGCSQELVIIPRYHNNMFICPTRQQRTAV